jgi:hypothetical protein
LYFLKKPVFEMRNVTFLYVKLTKFSTILFIASKQTVRKQRAEVDALHSKVAELEKTLKKKV